MSASQLRLASFILKDHYGEITEKVCLSILRKGWTTIAGVKQDTGLALSKIKKAICVLIQHNLVKFQKNARGQIMYGAQVSSILAIHQYSKITHCAKLVLGDAAELITEELLLNGSMTMSSVVANVTNRLMDPALSTSEQIDYHQVASQFQEMVEGHLLRRVICADVTMISKDDEEEKVDVVQTKNMEYDLPLGYLRESGTLKRKATPSDDAPAAKKRKDSNSVDFEDVFDRLLTNSCSQYDLRIMQAAYCQFLASNCNLKFAFWDGGIKWQVNIIQFFHHFINEMIGNAVRNRLGEFTADIIKVMLQSSILSRDGFSPQTNSVSVYDIDQKVSSTSRVDCSEITQYLSLLEDDEVGFVSKVGEQSGGTYVVNIKKSVEAICAQTIESVVRERCGSKSLRIFKLLRMKQHLEQKQVEDRIMVPSKEAKELLYHLLSEKFINLQEVPRATDYAPSRTFYLFSVNLSQVCRMLLDRSYKTLSNLISRRHYETEENKRLVEKSEKINATILALKSQGMDENSPALQEVEEMMTEQEKQQLTKLKNVLSKLQQSELQVGDTVLTFTEYLRMNS